MNGSNDLYSRSAMLRVIHSTFIFVCFGNQYWSCALTCSFPFPSNDYSNCNCCTNICQIFLFSDDDLRKTDGQQLWLQAKENDDVQDHYDDYALSSCLYLSLSVSLPPTLSLLSLSLSHTHTHIHTNSSLSHSFCLNLSSSHTQHTHTQTIQYYHTFKFNNRVIVVWCKRIR